MDNKIAVLCVDDEQGILNALKRILIDCDYTIFTAESGPEALGILEKEKIHIVISDYRMPVMNGAEFLRQVCGRWPDTIRIALSGYADTNAILSSINEGYIYKFIPKPWNNDELIVTIANAVELYQLVKEKEKLYTEIKSKNEELTYLNDQLMMLSGEKAINLEFADKVLTLYQCFFKSMPVAVCGIDFDDHVLLPNSRWNDIIGKGWIMSGGDIEGIMPEEIKRFIEDVKMYGEATGQMEINHISGRLTGSLVDFGNNKKGVILVFITEGMKDAFF